MIALVKQRPLGPGPPRFRVRYAEEILPELADREDGEALMDELESVLAIDPVDPPGHRSEKIEGEAALRRYRPHVDNGCRIFYAIEGDEVWILAVHPRKTAYRTSNLKTARARLGRAARRTD